MFSNRYYKIVTEPSVFEIEIYTSLIEAFVFPVRTPFWVHNEELPNVFRMIKSRRMRWAGHVAHLG
jgi:hypothetical protein